MKTLAIGSRRRAHLRHRFQPPWLVSIRLQLVFVPPLVRLWLILAFQLQLYTKTSSIGQQVILDSGASAWHSHWLLDRVLTRLLAWSSRGRRGVVAGSSRGRSGSISTPGRKFMYIGEFNDRLTIHVRGSSSSVCVFPYDSRTLVARTMLSWCSWVRERRWTWTLFQDLETRFRRCNMK